MRLSKRVQWRLKIFFVLVAATSMGGQVFVALFEPPDQYFGFSGVIARSLIGGSLFWGFEILWVPGKRGAFIRRLPFVWAFLVRIAAVAVIVTITGPLGGLLVYGVFDPFASFRIGPAIYLYVLGVTFVLHTISHIVRIVGPRVMLNIIFGRYRRPRREHRVFLFLDLKGSTLLAEQLGDLGVQKLIARFFSDITEPILEWGGEVHRYIGDEVVIMWPLNRGIKNASCLRCCLAIQDYIKARAAFYQRVYGAVPEFRIGLHGGPVVAAQCGEIKQEIVFFGDTINTTARIEQYCKTVERDLLVSDVLYDKLPKSTDWVAKSMGAVSLRGRQEKIGLLAVSRPSRETAADG